MLLRLCRWLRLLGYPTLSAHEIVDPREVEDEDEVLLEFCRERDALLITRDRALASRARSHSVLVRSDDVPGQLAEVLSRLGDEPYLDPDESRCPECNEPVERVRAENPGPFEVMWRCPECGKMYWVGGQWEDMERVIRETERRLRGSPE